MRNVRVVASVLLRPLQMIVYVLAGLSRRDGSWWVFGSWSGKRFSDNAAALFTAVATADRPNVRATWITARPDIARDLRRRGFDARTWWTPRGAWACLRAGTYLYDGYTKDISHWLSNGASCVLLRHGVGMKRLDRSIVVRSHRLYKLFHGRWWQRVFWTAVLPWHAVRPDLTLATSETHASQAMEHFGVRREQVLITGFPRHDALIRPHLHAVPMSRDVRLIRDDKGPTFLYMPTFRDGFARHDFDWLGLDKAAEDAGVVIFVKLHFVDAERGVEADDGWDRYTSLRLLDPTGDPTVLYNEVDGLITDFSSAAFDMMLLERPIIYFVPDYDSFVAMRGLYYPYDEVTPGPKCRTYSELSTALRNTFSVGIGEHTVHYRQLLERFYQDRDGRSCERAFVAITKELAMGEARQ